MKQQINELVAEINSLKNTIRNLRNAGCLRNAEGMRKNMAEKRLKVNKLTGLKVYNDLYAL